MGDDRSEFAKRLAAAMRALGLEARPSVLHARFNSRYHGSSVSFQTASRWLRGKAIPEQDKLVVLAQVFRTDPQTLRFGGKGHLDVREPRVVWPDRVGLRDQALFEDILALSAKQRELLRNLVEVFSEEARKRKSN
jgi:transcriptional regulator with XRE-family HTH domain